MKASVGLSSLLIPSLWHHAWHIANTNQYLWEELISFYRRKAVFTKLHSARCSTKKKKRLSLFGISLGNSANSTLFSLFSMAHQYTDGPDKP